MAVASSARPSVTIVANVGTLWKSPTTITPRQAMMNMKTCTPVAPHLGMMVPLTSCVRQASANADTTSGTVIILFLWHYVDIPSWRDE